MYPGQCGSRMVNKRLISGIGRHERGPVDAREQDSVGRSRLVSNILILDYFLDTNSKTTVPAMVSY